VAGKPSTKNIFLLDFNSVYPAKFWEHGLEEQERRTKLDRMIVQSGDVRGSLPPLP
jgi:hypothetical protein